MERCVEYAEEKIYKRKTGLVGIDFLQLMIGNGETDIQRMNEIAKQTKQFAKKMNVPLIAISQVTGVQNCREALDLMKARDSKTIPIMSDYVLGIRQKGGELEISLLKNRKGGLCSVTTNISKKSLRLEKRQ